MKKIVSIVIFLFGIVLASTSAFADFYVIPVPRGVGTEIRSFPYSINEPGFYYITKNLISTSCSVIGVYADNVTIDLMGFSLIGDGVLSGCSGIFIPNGTANVEIRNGTIRGFTWGINGQGAEVSVYSIRVIGIRAFSNTSEGIALFGEDHMVIECTASGNQRSGIRIGKFSVVKDTTSNGNQGSGISAGDGSTLIGNVTNNNSGSGIYAGDGSTLIRNVANNNSGSGIHAGEGSTVIGNASNHNRTGIDAANNSVIMNNATTGSLIVTGSSSSGVGIYTGSGCSITGNSANNNEKHGIRSASGSNVTGNTVRYNNQHGITISNGFIAQNSATDNNQSGGSYENINCTDCTLGLNHRP